RRTRSGRRRRVSSAFVGLLVVDVARVERGGAILIARNDGRVVLLSDVEGVGVEQPEGGTEPADEALGLDPDEQRAARQGRRRGYPRHRNEVELVAGGPPEATHGELPFARGHERGPRTVPGQVV